MPTRTFDSDTNLEELQYEDLSDYDVIVVQGNLLGLAEFDFKGRFIVEGDATIGGLLSFDSLEIEGNLEIPEDSTINATDIICNGNVTLNGSFDTDGNLKCKDISISDIEEIGIDGNLDAEKVKCHNIYVGGNANLETIDARSIACGGNLNCEEITAFGKINVDGDLECTFISGDEDEELNATIFVDGDMSVEETVNAKSITVGKGFYVGKHIICGDVRIINS